MCLNGATPSAGSLLSHLVAALGRFLTTTSGLSEAAVMSHVGGGGVNSLQPEVSGWKKRGAVLQQTQTHQKS